MDKNSDAPSQWALWFPMHRHPGGMAAQPSALWELVSQPRCLLLDHVIRIHTVLTVSTVKLIFDANEFYFNYL